jgi:vitamin B12 transporter
MHAALNSISVRAATCMAIALACVLAAAQSKADTTAPAPTLSPSPSPSPSALPSPSPTPKPTTVTLRENYLGKVIVHAAPREGYTVPVIELQRLGARTIADALRFVPGVLVRQTGTAGALQTVALRGNSAAQTLILLDGRPVNEGDTGVTDFTSMPLDGVQTIRVIEGGLSSRYGSGAIGGVVEIITKGPYWRPKDSAYAQVGYQGEFASGVGVIAVGTEGSLVLDAFTRYANNTFDYPSFGSIAGGTRTNNDLHGSDITLCACFSFGNHRYAANLHVEDNTSDVGAPGSTQFGPSFVSVFARQQRDVQRNALDLHYLTTNATTTAILYVDGRRLHFYDTTPSFPYDTLTLATQRGFSVEQTVRAGYNTLTVKYDQNGTTALFQGTIYSPLQLVARDSTTDLYVGDEYRGDYRRGPRIEGAVQFAHTQGAPSTTLPSIAASQQIGGTEISYGTLLRASYARSFRAPNLDERYFPGFGNSKLQPEYASTFDAGVVTNNRVVDATATLFGSDTNNLIVNQAIDMLGDFLPFNVGRARVRGFSAQVSNAYGKRLGVQASYTGYPVAKDLSTAPDINGVLTTGNRLLYRPTATATLEIWRMAGHEPYEEAIGEDGLDLLFVGRQYADEENLHLLPPYATVGLHVSRNLSPHLNLLLRVDNLTDQRVPQVYGYPVLGTTFSVRLTAK